MESNFFAKANCSGRWDSINQKLTISEDEIINLINYNNTNVCKMTCALKYSIINGQEFLTGTYKSLNQDGTFCGSGIVKLSKKMEIKPAKTH